MKSDLSDLILKFDKSRVTVTINVLNDSSAKSRKLKFRKISQIVAKLRNKSRVLSERKFLYVSRRKWLERGRKMVEGNPNEISKFHSDQRVHSYLVLTFPTFLTGRIFRSRNFLIVERLLGRANKNRRSVASDSSFSLVDETFRLSDVAPKKKRNLYVSFVPRFTDRIIDTLIIPTLVLSASA